MKPFQLSMLLFVLSPRHALSVPSGGYNLDTANSIYMPHHGQIINVFNRQNNPKNKNMNNGPTCPRCASTRCRNKDHFRDQNDCKCKACPPGQKPMPSREACASERKARKAERHEDESSRRIDKAQEKWEKDQTDKKRNRKQQRHKQASERKKEASRRKNEEEKKKKDDEEKRKKDEADKKKQDDEEKRRKDEDKNNRKRERMGKCLLIAPLAVIPEAAAENHLNEFFSEDFLADDRLLGLWPSEMDDVPDVNLETKQFMDGWTKERIDPGLGDEIGDMLFEGSRPDPAAKRSQKDDNQGLGQALSSRRDLALVHQDYKRILPAILAAVSAIARFFAQLASMLVNLGITIVRFARFFAQGGANIARGAGKANPMGQGRVAERIANSHLWRNCIRGNRPGM